MYESLYIEVDLFCICILLLLVRMNRQVYQDQTAQILFTRISLCSIVLFFLDFLWVLLEKQTFAGAYEAQIIVNAWYFVQASFIAYEWFSYADYSVGGPIRRRKWAKILCQVPVYALIFMAALSPWTGWVFSVDDFNHYHRGSFFAEHQALIYFYFFMAFVVPLYHALKKENFIKRESYIALCGLGVLPLFTNILQVCLPGSPMLPAGITLAVLFVFITEQSQMISIDPLTGLNNRMQFYKHLTKKMNETGLKPLYLCVLDADDFKKINDTYGHGEGDKAIVTMANVLKKVCGPRNGFIARYGGDEFVLVGEFDAVDEVEQMKVCINEELADASSFAQYKLHMSIGYAEYDDSMTSIPDFFNKADAALYRIKKSRHYKRI